MWPDFPQTQPAYGQSCGHRNSDALLSQALCHDSAKSLQALQGVPGNFCCVQKNKIPPRALHVLCSGLGLCQSLLLPLTAPPPAPPALTVPHLLGDLWQSEVEFSPPISVTLTKATLSDIPLFFVVLAKQFFHFFPTVLSAYVPGVIRIQQRTQKNTVSLQSLCSFDDHGRLCYRVSLACLAPFSLWISSLQGGSLVTSTEAYAMLFHR